MNARKLIKDPAALQLRAVRGVFRTLSAVSPAIAARAAGRIWFTPPRPQLPARARDFLATGTREELLVHGRKVVTWSWGAGPAILFVHGWGGSAAQVQGVLEPLVTVGYRVITFDAPAHGASGASRVGKRQSTFFDFADAMIAIGKKAGIVAGVIAHSGGCTAVAWAIRNGWRVPRAVFVAPMASPRAYQSVFQQVIGASDDVMQRFAANTEKRLQFKWEELEVPPVAALAETPHLLVVHDRDDPDTPWTGGAAIAAAWPNARLMTTEGLGHRKVLRDPSVVRAVGEFLADR